MNKLHILLFFIINSTLVSCQQKEFSELENKKLITRTDNPEYFEKQLQDTTRNKYFVFYKSVYEFVTTKDESIKIKENQKTLFPWDINNSETSAELVLENILDSIHTTTDGYSEYAKTPSSDIRMISPYVLKFSENEAQEFKDGTLRSVQNILDYVNYEYVSYDLKNEEDKNVKITREYAGLCSNGIYEREDGYYHGFCMFNQSLKPDYKKLKGEINLIIQVPYDYELRVVTREDVGKHITIGENKIKILEFEANAFHYQIVQKRDEFQVEYNVGGNSELILPYAFYKKLRTNQGLSFEEVLKKKNFFEIDRERSDYKEEVFITKFNNYSTDSVYFYIPKYLSKKVKVSVNIN